MMAGPDRSAAHKANAVPDHMKMLPPVLDVFNDHALVMEHFVTVFLLAAFNDGQNLLIGQVFALHRVDADMVQRLGAAGATGHFIYSAADRYPPRMWDLIINSPCLRPRPPARRVVRR